ncbi:MAG: GspH/FimT family pseudopilin [Gammaproteobacteria bacterium]
MTQRAPASPGSERGAGFTLLELMVALAVVALLLTTAPPMLSRAMETMEYRAAVRHLLAGLKGARQTAIETGTSVAFTVAPNEHRFGVGDELTGELPPRLVLRLVVADAEIGRDRGAIRFYPDGSATGGSIEILRPSGEGVRLRVDWLLGRISQEAPGA